MSDNTKQLYRKSSDGSYPKIFPLAFVQGIKDKRNDKELLSYINEINHFKVDYNENPETTRCQVDVFIRKKGLYITYYNTNTEQSVTEYFKGNQSDVADDSIWGDSDNWELVPDKTYIESHAVIPNKSVNMDKLADDVIQAIGDSGLSADEEDITDRNGILKFKDKEYSIEEASGLGYKILRKNWVEDKNILTQDMISDENTIYEIRYDFDLNGEEIIVPEGCVLKFEGGSLSNGVLNGNRTKIEAGIVKIFDINITLSGTWHTVESYPEWFGAIGNGIYADNIAVQKCIDTFKVVILLNDYFFFNEVVVEHTVSILGIKNKTHIYAHENGITLFNLNNASSENIFVNEIVFDGDSYDLITAISLGKESDYGLNIIIDNNCFYRVAFGIKLFKECDNVTISNNYIQHCGSAIYRDSSMLYNYNSSMLKIHGNHIIMCYSNNDYIHIEGFNNLSLKDNLIQASNRENVKFVYLHSGNGVVINNCYLEMSASDEQDTIFGIVLTAITAFIIDTIRSQGFFKSIIELNHPMWNIDSINRIIYSSINGSTVDSLIHNALIDNTTGLIIIDGGHNRPNSRTIDSFKKVIYETSDVVISEIFVYRNTSQTIDLSDYANKSKAVQILFDSVTTPHYAFDIVVFLDTDIQEKEFYTNRYYSYDSSTHMLTIKNDTTANIDMNYRITNIYPI